MVTLDDGVAWVDPRKVSAIVAARKDHYWACTMIVDGQTVRVSSPIGLNDELKAKEAAEYVSLAIFDRSLKEE